MFIYLFINFDRKKEILIKKKKKNSSNFKVKDFN